MPIPATMPSRPPLGSARKSRSSPAGTVFPLCHLTRHRLHSRISPGRSPAAFAILAPADLPAHPPRRPSPHDLLMIIATRPSTSSANSLGILRNQLSVYSVDG